MNFKFIKFFAILLATFIGVGTLSPCEAIGALPLEAQTELADIYYDYQIKKSKATTPDENYQASSEFFTKFENLRSTYPQVSNHFLNLFCRNDIPACIKHYSQLTTILTNLSLNRLSGRIMVQIASLSGIIYSFEL